MESSATDSYVPGEEKDPRDVKGSAEGHTALSDPA